MTSSKAVSRWQAVLCCVLYIAVVIAAHPSLEMGTNDDWSYSRTAQVFAETGHFAYFGWASAMLGWQVLLGAAAIKLFGFSFTILRLTTSATCVVTAFLTHRCFRRCGLTDYNASIATLTFILSPLFVPLSMSFMTDVPGIFVLIVSLYGCIRAVQAETAAASTVWLVSATIFNAVGGTVRQIVWLGILVMIPCTTWLLRKRRHLLRTGIPISLLGVIFMVGCMYWFAAQPYALSESLIPRGLERHSVLTLIESFGRMGIDLLCLLLPLLVASLTLFGQMERSIRASVACGTFMIALLLLFIVLYGFRGVHYLEPVLGNYVTLHGVMDGTYILGDRPVVLKPPVRFVISLTALLAVLIVTGSLLSPSIRSREQESTAGILCWKELRVLLLPLTAAYIVLLAPRAAHGQVFDRYLLFFAFITLLLLGRFLQNRIGKLPSISLATAILVGLYSTAATHDAFAMLRARLAAVNELRSAGIPAEAIDGGFEFNGWNQVSIAGHVNEAQIKNPKTTYRLMPLHDPDDICHPQLDDLFPDIKPVYGLSFSPKLCGGEANFAPVEYRTWLPPHATQIFIVREQ